MRFDPLRLAYLCNSLASVFLIFLWLLTIATWMWLPDQIPIHFNSQGMPDAWGSKYFFLTFPTTGAFLHLGLSLTQSRAMHVSYPVPITDENRSRQVPLMKAFLAIMKAEVLLLFSYVQIMNLLVIFQRAHGLGAWFVPGFFTLTLGTIAIYIVVAFLRR